MLFYHFAFAGVSLVMLGLTIGAERVYRQHGTILRGAADLEWSKAALRFAVTSVLAVLWFSYIPLLVPDSTVFLW